MKKQSDDVVAATRRGREWLQQGIALPELRQRLATTYPHFSIPQRKTVMAALHREAGVLGTVVVDPRLSGSCVEAKQALRRNPRRASVLAVVKTPLCQGCQHRRGSTCGLIGSGPLAIVASPDRLPESLAERAATSLVASGAVSRERAEAVMALPERPSQRVARLYSTGGIRTRTRDIQDRQRSARVGSTFDGDGQDIDIKKVARGFGRVARQKRDREAKVVSLPGDAKIENKVSRLASDFQTVGLTVRPQRTKARKTVQMTRESSLKVPKRERIARGTDEIQGLQGDQARDQYQKLTCRARRLLANGRVDVKKASALLERFEAFGSTGVRPTRVAQRVIQQIKLLAGHLV